MTPTTDRDAPLPEAAFRWFGPNDPVPLAHVRQTGATAVFTALHQIPYGEVWPRQAIRERVDLLAAAGLRWTAVESVPVHENLKTGRGDLKPLLTHYAATLRNLAAEGVHTVIYNFMPVLDWIRTDMNFVLPDGARCLRYDPAKFCAFELHALQRPGAQADYTADQIARGTAWWAGLGNADREAFVQSIIDVFPGVKWGLTLDDVRGMLAKYEHLKPGDLENNLGRFHEAVVPAAEAAGVRLAIHPDDPPFPVLGLPRIVSTEAQIAGLLHRVDSPANGLCFCTGSLGANPANDLPLMFRRLASRVHATHLRSVRRSADGSFDEADHLGGSVDMPAVARAILDEQARRRGDDRADWRLAFRPDHGHVMLDDLDKTAEITPGYSCLGRMRGLAELRGLFRGLAHGRAAGG